MASGYLKEKTVEWKAYFIDAREKQAVGPSDLEERIKKRLGQANSILLIRQLNLKFLGVIMAYWNPD